MKRRPLVLIGLLATLAGCPSAATPELEEPRSEVSKPRKPPPAANASASASEDPPPPDRFVAIATVPFSASLFQVKNALLVAGQEVVPLPDKDQGGGNWIGVVEGDALKLSPKWVMRGWYHNIVAAHGTWPDGITLLATGDTGRAPTAERWVMANGELIEAPLCKGDYCNSGKRFVGMFEQKDSLVGLDAPFMMSNDPPGFSTLKGPRVKLKAQPAPKDCPLNAFGRPFNARVYMPVAAAALPDGTVLSYGGTCKEESAVESWKPGEASSSVTVLAAGAKEGNESGARFLVAPGASASGGVWLMDGALLRLDGGSWSRVDTPGPGEAATRAALATDGTFYLVTSGGLYRRSSDRWEAVELPGGAIASDVATDPAGTVFVLAGNTLFRERKSADAAGVAAADGAAPPAKPKPVAKAKQPVTPGGPRCANNVVILYGFTKVTPDDYDFPLTRKAIKGHPELKGVRFVVSRDYGRKFFAAQVPNFDTAKKLSKLIETGVAGSRPGIVCAEPEIIRELKINLTTGDVIQ